MSALDRPGPVGSGAHVFIVDDWTSLDHARLLAKESANASIMTCSPALLSDSGVQPLEAGVTPADIRQLADLVADTGRLVLERLSLHPECKRYALTIARLFPALEVVVYKAWLLARLEPVARISVVELPELPPLLRGHWSDLLVGDERADRVVSAGVGVPEVTVIQEEVPSLMERLRFEPLASIFYRFLMRVPERLRSLGGFQGTILVVSENSLVKEAGSCLALRGYALRQTRPARPVQQGAQLPEKLRQLVVDIIRGQFRSLLGEKLASRVVEVCLRRCQSAVAAFDRNLDHWRAEFTRCRGGKPAAVLTNYSAFPWGEALHVVCRELDVPLVCVQHGTGFELCTTQARSSYLYENAACDLYLTYSEAAVEIQRSNPYGKAIVRAVGQPTDLVQLGHRRSNGPVADICYVSTQAFIGNVSRPCAGGLPDYMSAEWEIDLIKGVLSGLPHSVLFKPYRAIRYRDENPIPLVAEEAGLSVYWPRIDLRYLLQGMRVLVLSHAASTLNWCLMSGKPVIYLHSTDQSPLYPGFEEALKQAAIVFDVDSPNFVEDLRSFLSQPIAAIEALWESKAQARRDMMIRYFGLTDGRAGRRAAREIMAVMKGQS